MSRLRFAAPDAGFLAPGARDTRYCWVSVNLSKRWTAGASYIRYVTVEPHQTVHFFVVWMSVDKWITCGLPTGLDKRVESSARQERPPRDESGEVRARGGASLERCQRLVGRVDTAGRDDLDAVAEFLTQSAHVFERTREERGAREPAGLLREARLLHAARIAAVDDGDARVARGRDRRLLVCVAKIRRHLDDDRLVGGLSHGAEELRQLMGPLGPSIDQPGIGRGDIDLDEVAEGCQALDHRHVVLRRLARGGHDERHAMRKGSQRAAIGLEA